VLVVDELAPSEAVRLDPAIVRGVIDRAGAATSHAAILLRAAGIPAVSGAASMVPAEGGTVAALDGATGDVWIDPAPAIEQAIRQREAAWQAARPPPFAGGPAVTRDGHRVTLFANVSGPADARAARAAGAEGIGLMRTEMLFLDRADAPDEAEQVALVAATLAPFQGLPVVVRTLDSGGDKPLPYLPMPAEANPYLGIRGIRLGLARPEVLLTQLRALLRAGLGHDLHIMFPMVATLDELQRTRALLESAHNGLVAEERPHAWPVKVGTMIEVPAAALTAGVLARVCEFFSVGTNDLTQYTLAAERGHPGLQGLADAAHPAVLRLIQTVVAAGRPVAVCGEAAADPEVAALLLALGVSELSMGAAALGPVRAALGTLSVERARAALPAALAATSAAEARAAIRAALDG
jgi:phosphocarrier protein FPr